jgi:hypothetical protein
VAQVRKIGAKVAIVKHNPDLSPTLPWSDALVNPPMWPAIISAVCGMPSENHRHPECSLPGCTCACHHLPAGGVFELRMILPRTKG